MLLVGDIEFFLRNDEVPAYSSEICKNDAFINLGGGCIWLSIITFNLLGDSIGL
jgi:hypothetical protein